MTLGFRNWEEMRYKQNAAPNDCDIAGLLLEITGPQTTYLTGIRDNKIVYNVALLKCLKYIQYIPVLAHHQYEAFLCQACILYATATGILYETDRQRCRPIGLTHPRYRCSPACPPGSSCPSAGPGPIWQVPAAAGEGENRTHVLPF